MNHEPADLHPRANNFGLLRVVLASLVIVAHSPELMDGDRGREPLSRLFGTLSLGEIAVDGFFLISGFLIVKSWASRPDPISFLAKRVLRIVPGFVAAYLISVLVVGRFAETAHVPLSELGAMALRDLPTLREPHYPRPLDFAHYPALNASMWTIKYEFRCYLLAGVAGLLGLSGRRWPWAVAFLLGATGLVHYDALRTGGASGGYAPLFRFVALFAAGALFYLYRERIPFTRPLALAAALGLAMCLGFSSVSQLGVAVFGGYLLFALAFARIPSVAHVGTRNDLSYGLYLYAWPIQQLLLRSLPGIALGSHIVLSLVLSLFAGFLSWRLVETPFMRAKGWASKADWHSIRRWLVRHPREVG